LSASDQRHLLRSHYGWVTRALFDGEMTAYAEGRPPLVGGCIRPLSVSSSNLASRSGLTCDTP